MHDRENNKHHRYYEFATAAYENNWSTRFHYAPFSPTDTLHSAQCFCEHRLALFMGLKPGMKVLDVGCGVGGPAREMAKLVGCEVIGITINQNQVDRAVQLTAQEGLTGMCTFIKADWHVRLLRTTHFPYACGTPPSILPMASLSTQSIGLELDLRNKAARHGPVVANASLSPITLLKPLKGLLSQNIPSSDPFRLTQPLGKQDLPFADNSFDAAFAIEATCHASSLRTVYTNICRVLKPGGVFGVSEWVLTPAFDPSNAKHIDMRNRMERGNGISNLHTSDEARGAMTAAGFDILHEEDFARYFDYLKNNNSSSHTKGQTGNNSLGAAVVGKVGSTEETQIKITSPVLIPYSSDTYPDPRSNPDWRCAPASGPLLVTPSPHRDWWWLLEGKTHLATTWADYWTAWKMSRFARRAWYALVWTLEHLGYSRAQGVCEAMDTMAYCVDSAADAGREGIFSPCWWFVATKPVGQRVADGNMKAKRKQYCDT